MLQSESTKDRNWYFVVMAPLFKQQQNALSRACITYRHHLLAVECLRRAKGPGGDPLKVAEFCAAWKWAMTLPIVGPTALVRKIGKAGGAGKELFAALRGTPANRLTNSRVYWGSRTGPIQSLTTAWPQIAVFDITGSINLGIKLIAHMVPLIAKLQMKQAELISFDMPIGDRTAIGAILQRTGMPAPLIDALKKSHREYLNAWSDVLIGAETMEEARVDLGLPADAN